VRRFWVTKALAFLVFGAAILAALSYGVMLLWNSLVPSLFAGPTLHFWQALGLLVLSRILVGGFRGYGRHGHWRHRMWRDRWERMTPDERERFRDGFKRWREMTREERAEFRRGFRGCCGHGWNEEATEQSKET